MGLPGGTGTRPERTQGAKTFAWRFDPETDGAGGCSDFAVIFSGAEACDLTNLRPLVFSGSVREATGWPLEERFAVLYQGTAALELGSGKPAFWWAVPSAGTMQGSGFSRIPTPV